MLSPPLGRFKSSLWVIFSTNYALSTLLDGPLGFRLHYFFESVVWWHLACLLRLPQSVPYCLGDDNSWVFHFQQSDSSETLHFGPSLSLSKYTGWCFDESNCGRSDCLASEAIVLDEVSQRPPRPFLLLFLGPNLQHMEVPRLRAELEL